MVPAVRDICYTTTSHKFYIQVKITHSETKQNVSAKQLGSHLFDNVENSEMKIESFSGKDSGVIDLVKGKIRSQVTKDYLQ